MRIEYFHLGGNLFMPLSQQSLYFVWRLIWKSELRLYGFGKMTLVKLIKARFSPNHAMKVLQLPVKGTWCRIVRGGFKVFDLGNGRVIKVYKKGTEKEKMKREVALFSDIGQREFAPSLKNWDFDEGWYEEEFIQGLSGYGLIPKESSKVIMDRYFSVIEPILTKLILNGSPKIINILHYLEKLESTISIAPEIKQDKGLSKAIEFIDQTTKRCKALIDQTRSNIYVTLCHGDFHQFNMFWNGNSLKLIDWEAAQQLSILFDFFNFFFSQLYLEKCNADWPQEVDKGFRNLHQKLHASDPRLAESLIQCAEIYRLIYYIERIHTFIGTFRLDVKRIDRWIEAFEKFEKSNVR